MPFQESDLDNLKEKIVKTPLPPKDIELEDKARDLLEKMLKLDPKKRISI